MNLILLKKEDFSSQQSILLHASDKRYVHIVKILKLNNEDTFKAGVLDESIGEVQIIELSKHYLKGVYEIKEQAKKPAPIHLILGSSRPLVMKRVLKDIASLNIHSLSIFVGDNSEKSYSDSSLWKPNNYNQVIEEGLCQGAVVIPPALKFFPSLGKAIENTNFSQDDLRLILDPYQDTPWPSISSSNNTLLHIAIGAERGFTSSELDIAKNQNFIPTTLTKRILRTESAVTGSLVLALHSLCI